jgi:alpha-D-ribose 1-methylphosphonate 5-triphosphate synthase subunit PhnG
MDGSDFDEPRRPEWLSLLAKAPHDRLIALATPVTGVAHALLRPAEIGTVMVRGRIGGTGAPFNLGEMTVTRCSVRIGSGEVGHGYVQGRSKAAATAAALVDALMQTGGAAQVRASVLEPLAAEARAIRATRAAKAAATKVDFFTMVRGED